MADEIADLADATYQRLGPKLGAHSACRLFSVLVAGIAAGRGVACSLHFDPDYREDGQQTGHFWVTLDGARLDMWDRRVRVRRE